MDKNKIIAAIVAIVVALGGLWVALTGDEAPAETPAAEATAPAAEAPAAPAPEAPAAPPLASPPPRSHRLLRSWLPPQTPDQLS